VKQFTAAKAQANASYSYSPILDAAPGKRRHFFTTAELPS
jgi:hypothetical protein